MLKLESLYDGFHMIITATIRQANYHLQAVFEIRQLRVCEPAADLFATQTSSTLDSELDVVWHFSPTFISLRVKLAIILAKHTSSLKTCCISNGRNHQAQARAPGLSL